jgi:hypothetical protein
MSRPDTKFHLMAELTADDLRARGIDHDRAQDDDDLIDSVQVLLDRGVTLDELEGLGFANALSQRTIRPDPLYTDEAALALREVGIDGEFSRRLRLAMGHPGGTGMGLTSDELEATRLFASLADLVGEEEMLSVVRVVGSSTARIARAITAGQFSTADRHDTGSADRSRRGIRRSYRCLTPRVSRRDRSARSPSPRCGTGR